MIAKCDRSGLARQDVHFRFGSMRPTHATGADLVGDRERRP